MKSTPRIRLLVVDDHSIVREGILALVSAVPDMKVVGFAATGREAVRQYLRHRPDVTLMDLQLPEMNGFEAISAIRREDANARIMVLTMHHGDVDISRAFDCGACAYLLKNTLADNLISGIRDVYSGKPGLGEAGMNLGKREAALSPREEEVMQMLALGQRNKEIGASLGISDQTVDAHIKRIFAKLRVHDRTAALVSAIRRGIVHLD